MVALVLDPWLERSLIRKRRARGIDGRDEVWDGVYVIYPPSDNEHQELLGKLSTILWLTVNGGAAGKAYAGCNISDRTEDWTQNYRCPDAIAILNDTRAIDCGTHWFGGPDFGVEIVSPHDRTREKFDFYAKVGTRELLIVDRYPWALELYRLQGEALALVGRSTPDQPDVLASEVVPLAWRLLSGTPRPQIEATHADGRQRWVI